MGFPESFEVPSCAVKNHQQQQQPPPPQQQQLGDGQRKDVEHFYKQIGNAVCPPVVQSIGAEMVKLLVAAGAGVKRKCEPVAAPELQQQRRRRDDNAI